MICVCCTAPNASPLHFVVRGISGFRYTGLVLVRGRALCDDCVAYFYGI